MFLLQPIDNENLFHVNHASNPPSVHIFDVFVKLDSDFFNIGVVLEIELQYSCLLFY